MAGGMVMGASYLLENIKRRRSQGNQYPEHFPCIHTSSEQVPQCISTSNEHIITI